MTLISFFLHLMIWNHFNTDRVLLELQLNNKHLVLANKKSSPYKRIVVHFSRTMSRLSSSSLLFFFNFFIICCNLCICQSVPTDVFFNYYWHHFVSKDCCITIENSSHSTRSRAQGVLLQMLPHVVCCAFCMLIHHCPAPINGPLIAEDIVFNEADGKHISKCCR